MHRLLTSSCSVTYKKNEAAKVKSIKGSKHKRVLGRWILPKDSTVFWMIKLKNCLGILVDQRLTFTYQSEGLLKKSYLLLTRWISRSRPDSSIFLWFWSSVWQSDCCMAATSISHMDQIDQLDPLVLGSLLLELKNVNFNRFMVQKIKQEAKLKQTCTVLYMYYICIIKYTMGYTF